MTKHSLIGRNKQMFIISLFYSVYFLGFLSYAPYTHMCTRMCTHMEYGEVTLKLVTG